MELIKNGVNELTLSEQKAILSAQGYKITTDGAAFNSIVLYLSNKTIIWAPSDIDAAIVYCKKNNLIHIHK